jgi:hypothetical protein
LTVFAAIGALLMRAKIGNLVANGCVAHPGLSEHPHAYNPNQIATASTRKSLKRRVLTRTNSCALDATSEDQEKDR